MKIHILYPFVEGPWGGGNQFLKALRHALRELNVYAEKPENADVIMMSNFPFRHENLFKKALKLKRNGAKLVYRLDGLFYENREVESDKYIDNICKQFINTFADGAIYQTEWTKKRQQEFGLSKNIINTCILNAPNKAIFKPKQAELITNCEKLNIIITCWAANKRKGFETYKFIDEHMDTSKFNITYVGNSPIVFKNIIKKDAMSSESLAKELAKNDIFLSAAYNEPCSNSLIEAMHVGLIPLGHNSGGTPEIINNNALLFNTQEEAMEKLNTLYNNWSNSQKYVQPLPNIKQIAQQYVSFFEKIQQEPSKPITNQSAKEFSQLLKAHNMPVPQWKVILKNTLRPIKNIILKSNP